MSSWAPEGFNRAYRSTSLEPAVLRLSPKAKQAFHAAATLQELKRKTWDGCAFNAAGRKLGVEIQSYELAAQTFDMNVEDVKRFIRAWDNSPFSTDARATKYLKGMLEDVGLFTEPEVGRPKARTFVTVVHESDLSTEDRLFNAMVEGLDFDGEFNSPEMQQFKEAVIDATLLLDS